MKPLLPPGYITMGELHRRIGSGVYTRQWLSRLAARGEIPDAEPRPPSGKQWIFRDTRDVDRWVKLAQDAKKEPGLVPLVMKIERWFREETQAVPLEKWPPETRELYKQMLAGVARIYAQFTRDSP
jgi:hypothetical protein